MRHKDLRNRRPPPYNLLHFNREKAPVSFQKRGTNCSIRPAFFVPSPCRGSPTAVKVKQRLVRTRVIRAPLQVFVFHLHPSPTLLFRLNGRHFGVNIDPLFCLHLESEPQFEKPSPLSNYDTTSCDIRVKR